MRKRLVSILMALCMAVSLLPVQALAADDAYTVGEDTRAKVRLYSGSLVPEENCATLTLADGTVTVYIHTEERLPVVLADTLDEMADALAAAAGACERTGAR